MKRWLIWYSLTCLCMASTSLGFAPSSPLQSLAIRSRARRQPLCEMKILTNQYLPQDITLSVNGKPMTVREIFKERTGIIFAVPGAFTPTCTDKHLPGFLDTTNLKKIMQKVDFVGCLAVNDPFVLKAWARQTGAIDKIVFISDGNGELTRAIGMEKDCTGGFMGIRSDRYAMFVAKGGRVQWLGEGEDAFAEEVVAALQRLWMVFTHASRFNSEYHEEGVPE